MRSAACGKSTRGGPKVSCRLSITVEPGMPSGSARDTATKKPKPCWAGLRTCRRSRPCTSIFRAAGKRRDMLRVAIVGCGKIADAHASQTQRIAGWEIVGVGDREPLMARQLFERFPIRNYYRD